MSTTGGRNALQTIRAGVDMGGRRGALQAIADATTSQRAEVARTLKPMFEEQAKERMSEGGKRHGEGMANLPQVDPAKSRDQAAAAVGVSGRTVQDAEFVHTHARRRITPARDRRNMTDADIVRLVAQLDKRRTKAEAGAMKGKQAQGCASSGKSAVETAAVIGVSTRKVEQARAVLDSAEPEVKQAVMDGKKSINSAYQRNDCPRERRR